MRAKRISEELSTIQVYDGLRWIGSIVEQVNGQYEAGLPDGQSLGLYTSRQAAGHAIVEATRPGARPT
jgi:hypothetical protein